MDGQGTECRRNIAENLNRLSRAHECYRQTTDGRATAYSERSLRSLKIHKKAWPAGHILGTGWGQVAMAS